MAAITLGYGCGKRCRKSLEELISNSISLWASIYIH